jgi:hypothetical protein
VSGFEVRAQELESLHHPNPLLVLTSHPLPEHTAVQISEMFGAAGLLPPGEGGPEGRMSIFRQLDCLASIKELESDQCSILNSQFSSEQNAFVWMFLR